MRKGFKFSIDLSLYNNIKLLAQESSRSFSNSTETLILLAKTIYEQENDEAIIYCMRELKASRILAMPSLRALPPRKICHVKLCPAAIDFAGFLYSTYPAVFDSMNESISLCLAYAQQYLATSQTRRYLASRMDDVQQAAQYQ